MTLNELYLHSKVELQKAAIEDFEFESVVLIRHFFHLTHNEWLSKRNEAASPLLTAPFLKAVEERTTHRPLQYILGSWEFMGLEIAVGEGVLIPRDDTEVLVRTVSEWLADKEDADGLDLCAGSGAISLGLSSLHPDLRMTAIEISSTAFSFLVENLDSYAEYDIVPVQGDIFDEELIHSFTGTFDFIASNPPYIESDELPTLQEEVQREPHLALDGGKDGLLFYHEIVAKWKNCLKPGGLLAFEIGETQADSVTNILKEHGFFSIAVHKDLAGLNRVVSGIKT
ncbi:peptide chain release factor N(5)-glutamine methyltransferase [Scatolibacter rhodanostii]|uniref:peptide chain release factor N(5)-glutamine methyltransferase n=1 Tax=Scatolibacter rhodanostii TaxID=2014781 RepID=UPI000C07E1FA|nr:peptide chain release factor N(5)-glutamine methyltransferase [Scatolibacter rhodanostii]